jgi:hypothetical protein
MCHHSLFPLIFIVFVGSSHYISFIDISVYRVMKKRFPALLPADRRAERWTAFTVCILVAALTVQVLPLAVPLENLTQTPHNGVGAKFFEPLPICGNGGEVFSFTADNPWLPKSPQDTLLLFERTVGVPGMEPPLPDGHAPSVYRPPRLTSL